MQDGWQKVLKNFLVTVGGATIELFLQPYRPLAVRTLVH